MNAAPLLNKREILYSFLLALCYALAFYGLQFLLYELHVTAIYPTAENLNHWDVSWYKSIAQNGYQYSSTAQSNAGFYFLLPFIWKSFHLNEWGVCLLNVILFASAFGMLTSIYRISFLRKLLWLSMPTVFYIFVPYSEALFFMLATACVWGIATANKWIIWVSLFLLSLTRATAICLLPALLLMELISGSKRAWYSNLLNYLVYYMLPVLAGLAFFVWYQYHETGVWFAYFKQQSNFWVRKFTLPDFPVSNVSPAEWLSAIATLVCFIAVIFLVKITWQWMFKNKKRDKLFILSVGYLSMNLLVMLFFNPPTTVMGVFRYSMLTPFFYIFLYYFTGRLNYKAKDYTLIFFLSYGIWLAFGAFLHLQSFVTYSLDTLLVLAYMLLTNKKPTLVLAAIIVFNIIVQVYFFQKFIGIGGFID